MEAVEHQDLQYLYLLENITFQPVFILGLHRSGTSILYKMLTSTECFNPVTAYHLIKYDQLLDDCENKRQDNVKKRLTESFRKKGLDDRGIDKLKVSADFAEEYGFFLDEKSAQTFITKKNVSKFTEMCKKITYVSDMEKPILLKNPYDFSNFIYIKKTFPNAKFIFIHRHPFKVLSSLMTAVRVLFETNNHYASQLSRIYNKLYENPLALYGVRCLTTIFSIFGLMLLCIYSSKATKYYIKNIKSFSKEDFISITYEELCKDPQKNIENIMKSLNIKPRKKIDFTSFIKPRKTNLDPSVVELNRFISKTMRHYFVCFGYDAEMDKL